jgi:hypothetical protein
MEGFLLIWTPDTRLAATSKTTITPTSPKEKAPANPPGTS